MSLVIKYADSNCVIRDEFLDFLFCYLGLSGETAVETCLGGLSNLALDISI